VALAVEEAVDAGVEVGVADAVALAVRVGVATLTVAVEVAAALAVEEAVETGVDVRVADALAVGVANCGCVAVALGTDAVTVGEVTPPVSVGVAGTVLLGVDGAVAVAAAVAVNVGDAVALGVTVGDCDGVAVAVATGCVAVEVGAGGVDVCVADAVAVGEGVTDTVAVLVAVRVGVNVPVADAVAVDVEVAVVLRVAVAVRTGIVADGMDGRSVADGVGGTDVDVGLTPGVTAVVALGTLVADVVAVAGGSAVEVGTLRAVGVGVRGAKTRTVVLLPHAASATASARPTPRRQPRDRTLPLIGSISPRAVPFRALPSAASRCTCSRRSSRSCYRSSGPYSRNRLG
jgi:hypothetical protein